jgi:hypothetical protein
MLAKRYLRVVDELGKLKDVDEYLSKYTSEKHSADV